MKKRRLLSIVLTLCMVLALMPQMVFAGEGTSSGVYIFFDPSKFSYWKAPFYAYIYDEDTDSDKNYSNAPFPGQAMQVDPATGYYYIEVSDSSCIAEGKTSGESTASNFDLAHSLNTCVIISDSEGHRYPRDGLLTNLQLDGSTKLLSGATPSDWQLFIPKATITYELNGGTINRGNVTEYIYGQGVALPTDVTKTGYTFAGWYENKDFSGDSVTTISSTDTGNKMFYAKWDNIKDEIIRITTPDSMTVENGTAYEDMNLPETVEVETALNSVTKLPVVWITDPLAGGSYDPNIKTEQTVKLYGILQLPDAFEENPDEPAATTITITIKAAPAAPDDSNNTKPASDNSSDTGDSTNLPLLIGLMLLSIAGITGVTGYRRRKRIDE